MGSNGIERYWHFSSGHNLIKFYPTNNSFILVNQYYIQIFTHFIKRIIIPRTYFFLENLSMGIDKAQQCLHKNISNTVTATITF